MHTVKIIAQGRVQAVCFRIFVKENADKLGLFGWVENIDNDKIQILAQGKIENLNKLIELTKQGPSMARVDSIKSDFSNSDLEISSFEIQ